MGKLKVISVFGTRPETSKMAPVIKEMEKRDYFESIVCVTGQQREMLDQMLDIFDLTPDYDLNIMKANQSLTDITTNSLIGLEKVFKEESPDLVLVHGDPNTSFAAALASFYAKIKVGHVEAGLRTFNKYEPFPEEINRKLIGQIADLHFSPTERSKQNLLKEGIEEENIYITGNTAIDAIQNTVKADYKFQLDILNKIDYKSKRVIAMTAHRRENLGKPLENICRAARRIVDDNEDVVIVYAVHYNPAVRQVANKILKDHDRIILTDPIDMLDMHNLMKKSYMVLTDSGGLQEEAPALDKPVITLRNVTERPEGVDAGTLKLAGTDEDNIYNIASSILNNNEIYNQMANARNPFGDGFAAKRIVDSIAYSFGYIKERPLDYK